MHDTIPAPERAIAVAVLKKGADRRIVDDHLSELEMLAETAGANIVFKVTQELAKPNSATAIGSGKIQEIKIIAEESNISLIIFDDDLTPMQARNLEEELSVKILDRSGLILDIFAKSAKSVEAKTQVELAQLKYMSSRLTRMWTHLSKQFGGVGTKGPGETQIETDRRLIKDKITRLQERLETIDSQAQQKRKNRETLYRFALVGYTNAGKSTVMNALTNAGVLAENKLFATLDATVRSIELPGKQQAILSDTVGFIRKLPTHLIASFRSTLAEAVEADALIHVVDISHPSFRDQISVVEQTLKEIGADNSDLILVFNKSDAVENRHVLEELALEFPNSVCISAIKQENLEVLLQRMKQSFEKNSTIYSIKIPYSDSHIIGELYQIAEIMNRNDDDDGIICNVRTSKEMREKFRRVFAKYFR